MFRIIVSAVVAVVLVVAGWSGYWLFMSDRLNLEIDKNAVRQGQTLSCASRQTTGYPFVFHIACDDFRLAGTRGPEFELIAPRVTVTVNAFNLRQMDILFTGPVKAEFQDAENGAGKEQRSTVQLRVAQMPVYVLLRPNQPPDIAVELEDFRGRMTHWQGQKPVQNVRVAGQRFSGSLTLEKAAETALIDVTAKMLKVRFDPPPADGFAETEVATAHLRASADKSDALRGKTMARLLKSWQEAGGEVRNVTFDATTDQLELEGEGTLKLDKKGRVNARLATGIAGMDRLLVRLVKLDLIKKDAAILVRAAADLLSDNRAGDNGRWVRLPLRIKRGKVYFGPIPLGKLQRAF